VNTLRRAAAGGFLAAALALAGCGRDASPAMTPPGSGAPGGPWVTLAARDVAFETAELDVPANVAFTLVFENREAVPHDVSIERSDADHARLFEGAVFSGPATRWYAVPALAPGEYTFVCAIHPNMTGRLVAA
jgi:plastocyanin